MTIQYSLHPIHITADPNDRSARVEARANLTLADITQRMLRRGTMVTETDIKAIVDLLFDVVADELAQGSAVTLPLVKLRPSIRGVFLNVNDAFDPSRHKITAAVSPGLLLARKMRGARTEKVPASPPGPEINSFEDINSGSVDSVLTPGGIGRISGQYLKFDQSQEDEGVFFVNENDEETRVAVIASITDGQITFMVPQLPSGDYVLEVRRAYTTARRLRTGSLDQSLTVAAQVEST